VGLSASLRQWVDATLAGLQLVHADATVWPASTAVEAGPDHLVAERLGILQSSVGGRGYQAGIAAAKAAGCSRFVRAASTALPPLPDADLVWEDYSQFDLAFFEPLGAEALD
jgi:hypothetical protein